MTKHLEHIRKAKHHLVEANKELAKAAKMTKAEEYPKRRGKK